MGDERDPRVVEFWRKISEFFAATMQHFDHQEEWEANTVMRQIRRCTIGEQDYVCQTGKTYLPLRWSDDLWRRVGTYLERTEDRSRVDVLAELKLVASGVRNDPRLSQSVTYLPLQ